MTQDKMNPKTQIDGVVDLAQFVRGGDQDAPAPKEGTRRKPASVRSESTGLGRPADVEGEPRNAPVNVKFTQREKQDLEDKAHGVPLSSFIRSKLIEAGII